MSEDEPKIRVNALVNEAIKQDEKDEKIKLEERTRILKILDKKYTSLQEMMYTLDNSISPMLMSDKNKSINRAILNEQMKTVEELRKQIEEVRE